MLGPLRYCTAQCLYCSGTVFEQSIGTKHRMGIYLFYLRNQYTKLYERKDRKHRKTGIVKTRN